MTGVKSWGATSAHETLAAPSMPIECLGRRNLLHPAVAALNEQRDLALTTDFRDVLGELVVRHLGNSQINHVFPGYDQPKYRGIIGA